MTTSTGSLRRFPARMAVQGGQDTIPGPLQQDLANLESDEFVIDAKDEMRVLFHRVPARQIEPAESL